MSSCTRRDFNRFALSVLPAAGLIDAARPLFAADKPDSRFAGVQVGCNVPYSFGNAAMTGDEILKSCLELGLSAVELRTQPVEAYLGAPYSMGKPDAASIRAWREGAVIDRAKEFRKTWRDAGVRIQIVKVDGLAKMSEGELDYAFKLAKTLGARAISTEIFHAEADLKRVGRFADKHKLFVGYHGHAETGPEEWERAFSFAKYNGANVDIGHFVAGDHGSPVPFITKHHARVTHVHIKDRKKGNGPNTPFGEGDTPIVEVLRLIRDNKWPIQATIEFEYKVPAGSTRMAEIARAIKYCRDALL
ncbi:MAG: sugar phosphate isomerase/epimerase family protein [Actinomycetota bacterium]